VAAMVDLFPSTYQMISGPPAETVSSPAMSQLSAPPTPTERPEPSIQVAVLPETSPADTPPLTASATAGVPQTAVQDMGLPLETATSETPPAAPAPPAPPEAPAASMQPPVQPKPSPAVTPPRTATARPEPPLTAP